MMIFTLVAGLFLITPAKAEESVWYYHEGDMTTCAELHGVLEVSGQMTFKNIPDGKDDNIVIIDGRRYFSDRPRCEADLHAGIKL